MHQTSSVAVQWVPVLNQDLKKMSAFGHFLQDHLKTTIGGWFPGLTGQHVIDGAEHPVNPVEYRLELVGFLRRFYVYLAKFGRHKDCYKRLVRNGSHNMNHTERPQFGLHQDLHILGTTSTYLTEKKQNLKKRRV